MAIRHGIRMAQSRWVRAGAAPGSWPGHGKHINKRTAPILRESGRKGESGDGADAHGEITQEPHPLTPDA